MEGQTPQDPKVVWIACRATDGCKGNQAEIVFVRSSSSNLPGGGFVPEAGGRSIRYKCLTCGKPFHVKS